MRAGCLFCRAPLRHTLVDLGMSPLCESYLAADQLDQMEPFYPLRVWVCNEYFLVPEVKEHGVTAEEFPSTKYLRLKQIKKLQGAQLLDDTLRWIVPAATLDGGSIVL